MADSPVLSAGAAAGAGFGNPPMPSSTSMPSVASATSTATSIPPVSQENGAELPNEEDVMGSEAVEKELRELLGKMEESYKEFSETVFKKKCVCSILNCVTSFTKNAY